MMAKWHSDQQLTRCRVTHLQVKAAAVATRVMAEQRGTPAQSPSVSVTRSGTTINVRPPAVCPPVRLQSAHKIVLSYSHPLHQCPVPDTGTSVTDHLPP
jgi:hypothetical protein